MTNYLCTFNGEIGSVETFTHTMSISSEKSATDVTIAMENAMIAAFDISVSNGVSARFSEGVVYTHTTAAEILDLTTGALYAAYTNTFQEPRPSGSGTDLLVPQCALAITTVGGNRPNGTPLLGRYFLPPPSGNFLTADFTLSEDAQDVFLQFVLELHRQLEANGCQPVLWSRSLGSVSPIGQLRVGRVVDTIRSRRGSISESYVTGTP